VLGQTLPPFHSRCVVTGSLGRGGERLQRELIAMRQPGALRIEPPLELGMRAR
jgi:hypothetical protein